MNNNLLIFNVLVLVGSCQGILTSFLLWLSSAKNHSKRLLAGLLLVFVLLSFKILLHTLHLWDTPYLRYFPLAIDLVIQPLFYLYVQALTTPGFRLARKDLYHFVPASIFMVHAVLVYASVMGIKDLGLKDKIAEAWHFNQIKSLEDYLVIVSSCGYWYLAYRRTVYYRQWLYNTISATNYPEYTWLRNLLIMILVLFGTLAFNMLLDIGFGFDKFYFLHWQLFYVYMSGFIYYLGFKGYHQNFQPVSLPKITVNKVPVSEPLAGEAEALRELVVKAMVEDKIYLDPDLSLAALAQHLNTNPALLSITINTYFKQNFRNLINTYRVEEVKKKMANPGFAHLTLLGMALESGFNSEASFYRIFRKLTGESPKDYARTRNT